MDAHSVTIHVALRSLLEPNGSRASRAAMDRWAHHLLRWLRGRGKKALSRLLHPSHGSLRLAVRCAWPNYLFDRDKHGVLAKGHRADLIPSPPQSTDRSAARLHRPSARV